MPPWPSIARLSRLYSTVPIHSFNSLISNPAHKYQIYISQSRDPFLNLSIEHHLLQKSHKDSTILFLYTNNPCVVIGRNQNPWLEVNLKLLNAAAGEQAESGSENRQRVVDLVRRRSGGGAVFHDEGNVNYSVICPSAAFTRDKHAEMVTRAMRKFNPRARVNERHDIVLDQGSLLAESSRPDPDDMHQTSYATSEMPPLKVSGSAYKLTRERSLHHGTCLLSSENLNIIGKYLASPARGYTKARGVESVRSPVGNVFSDRADKEQARFQHEVIREFAKLYRIKEDIVARFDADFDMACLGVVAECSYGHIGEELLSEVNNGVEEMKVRDAVSSMIYLRSLTCFLIVVSKLDLLPNASIHALKSCL